MRTLFKLFFLLLISLIIFRCDLEEIPDLGSGDDLTACFTFNILDSPCNSDCRVQFNNCSSNATSYEWDFGDGNSSTEASPLHNYTTSGDYNVRLRAFDNSSYKDTTITVQIFAPGEVVASFTYSASTSCPALPCEITFQNNSQNAEFSSWDFGDGNTSFDKNPVHSYHAHGKYLVKLIAQSGNGDADSDSMLVEIVPNTFNKELSSTDNYSASNGIKGIDGGFVFVGSTNNNVLLLKYDENGISQWKREYGDVPNSEFGYDVCYSNNNGYTILAEKKQPHPNPASEIFLIETDIQGNEIQSYSNIVSEGNDTEYISGCVEATQTGNYLVSIYEYAISHAQTKIFFVDPTGAVQTKGNYLETTISGIGKISSGFIFFGSKEGQSTHNDVFLIKTDDSGNEIDKNEYGETLESEYGTSLIQSYDGELIVGGTKNLSTSDIHLLKVDQNLVENNNGWPITITDDINYGNIILAQSWDNNIAITGWRTGDCSGEFEAEVFLLKTNYSGQVLWNKTLLECLYGEVVNVFSTSDSGFIVLGYSYSYDLLMLKTDSEGVIWD